MGISPTWTLSNHDTTKTMRDGLKNLQHDLSEWVFQIDWKPADEMEYGIQGALAG